MVSAIAGSYFSMNRMLAALAGTRPQPPIPAASPPSSRPGEVESVGKSELSEHELAEVGNRVRVEASSLASQSASAVEKHGSVRHSAADTRFAQSSHQPAGQLIDVRA